MTFRWWTQWNLLGVRQVSWQESFEIGFFLRLNPASTSSSDLLHYWQGPEVQAKATLNSKPKRLELMSFWEGPYGRRPPLKLQTAPLSSPVHPSRRALLPFKTKNQEGIEFHSYRKHGFPVLLSKSGEPIVLHCFWWVHHFHQRFSPPDISQKISSSWTRAFNISASSDSTSIFIFAFVRAHLFSCKESR